MFGILYFSSGLFAQRSAAGVVASSFGVLLAESVSLVWALSDPLVTFSSLFYSAVCSFRSVVLGPRVVNIERSLGSNKKEEDVSAL